MKYVIISNRLPVTVVDKGGKLKITRSSGGLATGLDSLETNHEKHWIGWAGLHIEEESEQRRNSARMSKKLLHPVYLSPDQIQKYYEGYSNSTLWPLCHYFLDYISYDKKYWKTYREVNELFCEEALKIIEPDDVVWVHDYQLMLLPAMLRAKLPDVAIGYFHHIPFPSYEMFRYLPERAEILHGLLGADLVSFHTQDYLRHFVSALYRVLNIECVMDEARMDRRVARLEARPMGINYDMYHDAMHLAGAQSYLEELKQLAGESRIILSVDRLDYSKGILLRLESFAAFLENNPEYRGKVTMIMVVVPSRDNVDIYADLKTRIDQMIGSINGAYASLGWTPIHFFYRSFPFTELSAMYHIADIALVTPLRDGMNLVAKEYVAAKQDRPGVLILSEMAGAASELTGALIVNPTDSRQVQKALLRALTMSEEEQLDHLREMQTIISRQTVGAWANGFIDELQKVRDRNLKLKAKFLDGDDLQWVADRYAAAKSRLLILDYDGTLVPFVADPAMAKPSVELRELLRDLAADPRNKVAICSGRDQDTLEQWLGGLGLTLAAEHGAFLSDGGEWRSRPCDMRWQRRIIDIVEQIHTITPDSEIEVKKAGVAWHFRKVDNWLAELRVAQLITSLSAPCSRYGLRIMRGDKVVEVKPSGFNKGTLASRLADRGDYDFILAAGDDATDEDMFEALPDTAVTIKVGRFSDLSRFTLSHQGQMTAFLRKLCSTEHA